MTVAQRAKVADIRARGVVRNMTGVVVYLVKSSDGITDYHVTVVRGKVSGCDCPAHSYGHTQCYIKRDVQIAEDARHAREAEEAATMNAFSAEIAASAPAASPAWLWMNRRRFNTPAGQRYLASCQGR